VNAPHDVSRRTFLKAGAAIAGGLVIGFSIPLARRFMQTPEAGSATFAPNAFLRIGADDSVTVILAHAEMGQGVWTTLPMLIAEELDADWSKIRVEHAPAAAAYGMPQMGGMQITGGSTSTRFEFDRYRQAGAAARALLVQAAAQRLGVQPGECRTENGVVVCGERRLRYGELADEAGKLPMPDTATLKLKEAKEWKLIGKSTRRLDSLDKVSGRARFGLDVQMEGLKTAVIARSPTIGGTLKSFDAAEALAIPGVLKAVQVPTGVAVIAEHFWAAKRGRDALKTEWDAGAGAALDSDTLMEEFRKLAQTPGLPASEAGDVHKALAAAATRVEAQYEVPYLAHAPMEPLNCSVRLSADKCEIWAGTQFQSMDQTLAAKITGLKPEQIEIHTMFLGGAFGRRANPTSDFVSEAVHVAKASGLPVKLVWTREDDVRGGYYRPAFVHRAEVGLGKDGFPVAWKQVLAGQSIAAGTPLEAGMVRNGVDATSVEGVSDSPYIKHLPDHRVGLHSPSTGILVLWMRSVGHMHTGFAMESLVDELAHAAKQDPLAYRQHLLKAHPRHLAALNLAAEKAGWGGPLPAGRARGIAVHESFASFVAQVAEVSVEDGRIRVHRVVCAIDCGLAVNPDGVAAQMESGVAFGLGAALHSKLTIRKGQVQESNYHDFQVLRLNEMPQVETHIVPSSDPMGGVGEVAVPPIAPAVANALFALTGQRLRQLPLTLKA
jgi:isoquinoline 1-oxidoreductase beta subunit